MEAIRRSYPHVCMAWQGWHLLPPVFVQAYNCDAGTHVLEAADQPGRHKSTPPHRHHASINTKINARCSLLAVRNLVVLTFSLSCKLYCPLEMFFFYCNKSGTYGVMPHTARTRVDCRPNHTYHKWMTLCRPNPTEAELKGLSPYLLLVADLI